MLQVDAEYNAKNGCWVGGWVSISPPIQVHGAPLSVFWGKKVPIVTTFGMDQTVTVCFHTAPPVIDNYGFSATLN